MNYLVDTGALVRIQRNQVDPRWAELVGRGLVAVCEPVLAEALAIAEAKRYMTVARFVPQLEEQRISAAPMN